VQYKVGDSIEGKYSVLKVFGGENQSGMGVVYLVEDRDAPKPYVIKTYQSKPGFVNQNRFKSEAHAWVNAGVHPNIVQAYWVRKIDGQLYTAAEYIAPDDEGRNTLTQFLRTGFLRLEIVFRWAAHFCHGMNYALKKGVLVHRDIKPDNLMIDGNVNLKITDFGLAKSLDVDVNEPKKGWWPFNKKASPEVISTAKTVSAMGTPRYMPPEQFNDTKNVDHKGDIYSFGIILYQMVTDDSYPYKINSGTIDPMGELYRAHSQGRILHCDSPLMPIITKCLAKQPSKRYKDYDAFLLDLTKLAKKLDITLPTSDYEGSNNLELYAKAQSYVALGDSEKALEAINKYTADYPDEPCGWTEKGKIHGECKEYVEAVKATKNSVAIDPYNTRAWNNLGIFLSHSGAPAEEIKIAFKNALDLDPLNTAAMMNLAAALDRLGEYDDIPELIVRTMKHRPNKPNLIESAEGILERLFNQGNLSEAKTFLEGWVDAMPKHIEAWHNLGLVALNNGDLDLAIKCFKKVEALDPTDNFSIFELAKIYAQTKRGRDCLDYCNKLIARKHEILKAVCMKVQVMNLMGYYQAALKFIDPYIKHNKTNDSLWVVLADVHEFRDNYDAALDALKKAKIILEKHGRGSQYYTSNMKMINDQIVRVNLKQQ
jgi:serine/threonine protein kinase